MRDLDVMKIFIKIFAILSMISAAVSLGRGGGSAAAQLDQYAHDPLHATYLIDGVAARLMDGRCELPAAPASATKNEKLIEIALLGVGDQIFEGWVTIGHEVRSFEPCFQKEALWLMGHSPTLKEIMAAYRRALPNETTYRSLFMFLAGELVGTPADGFGADYEAAFHATHLVRVAPGENCTSEGFVFDSPISSRQKITFDISKLDEYGLHGPPGGKRALSYEFCIPDTVQNRTEVKRIDPTVKFFAESPGRIGCGEYESLCIGSTHQKDFRMILQRLAELTYVQRIDESFFE